MAEADAEPITVVDAEAEAAAGWLHELPSGTRVVADPGGTWRTDVSRAVGRSPETVLLVIADRFGAPRVVSEGAEAGELVAPSEATAWLRFVALDCPECSGEIAWPD
jgi:hypothetical protein